MTNFNLDSLTVGRYWPDFVAAPVPPRVVFRTVCLSRSHDLDAWAWQWAADPVWDLGEAGQLILERPLAPVPASSFRSRAGARLRFGGAGLVRFARVTIEVAMHARGVAEISVAPRARAPHLWAVARQARYFELAHRAADELVRRLPTCTRVDVAALPATSCAEQRAA